MKFLIIIPTYNEMENIPEIIPQILAQNENLEILVAAQAESMHRRLLCGLG